MAYAEERELGSSSMQRPPYFNGKYYSYWKDKMKIFVQSENYQVWRIIQVGDYEITKKNANNEVIPKPMDEYEKTDFEKLELNATAKKFLIWGLGSNEHTRVKGCKSAKEIWDLLEVTHEGTSDVKRSKIDILLSQYERFEMGNKESIKDMFTRFKNITNELTCLGKIIPKDEQVRKVLRSLPENDRWRAKVAAVQESKDFTKFNLEQLAGPLITHEIQLNNRTQETVKSQGLALNANEESKAKSDIDEEEAAMLVRRLKKFYRNNKFSDKKKGYSKRNQDSKVKSSCHKCGSTNHFIKECPLWEFEKGKGKEADQSRNSKPNFSKSNFRKAMISTWGDSSSEEEKPEHTDDEVANLCLIAKHNDEVKIQPSYLKSLSKEKLISLFLETLDEYKELCEKLRQAEKATGICRDHVKYLNNSRNDVQGRFFELLDKNIMLKESLERVKSDNIMLNVELTQYKMLCTNIDSCKSTEVPLIMFNTELEHVKKELKTTNDKNEKLEKDLEIARRSRSTVSMGVPKWVQEAQTKRSEGLGYVHKKKSNGKKKKYVDLPSETVCSFCGKKGTS
ncbi:uncharacterized protein LOC110694357 [Chenopodium quinoa]|uniref:uncharacterized protein LOC110694357 n=1 Tax=Chenopodium quinoa TaxID=63459 RepID=UPI000B78D68F|nr:uncharacterized protein LOC110694357 [Chenopodium quinoa]